MKKNSFRNFLLRFFLGYLPFGLLIAFLALFEINPILMNGEPISGFEGFLFGLLMIPLVVVAITIMVWLLYSLGDWILKILNKIRL